MSELRFHFRLRRVSLRYFGVDFDRLDDLIVDLCGGAATGRVLRYSVLYRQFFFYKPTNLFIYEKAIFCVG